MAGDQSWGRARKRCCGKKLICTIISQKDKASVRVGRGQLPTGSSPDKHREEEEEEGSLYLTLH